MSRSPYVTIWTEPRSTIRQIVDRDPRYRVIFLVVLGAELAASWGLLIQPSALRTSPEVAPEIVLHMLRAVSFGALVVSPIFALISLYGAGALLRWAGGLLAGTATAVEVRAAIAWSTVPAIVSTAISLLGLATGAVKLHAPPNHVGLQTLLDQINLFEIFYLILAIWGAVIWLKCLGEVHRFSAWRALGASVIATAVGMGIMLVLAITLMMLMLSFGHGS
ncbi:MAG: YIP1 family protein [Candidatus Binataceae bacterium]